MPQDRTLQPLIEVTGFSKKFGEIKAIDNISFDIIPGEIFGFLGPNGAGKTTTISVLTGLARPDSGKIIIAGLDCKKNPKIAQHLIGVVPDESNLYPELSGFDNLCFCGSLYGMRKRERQFRANELLETFDLADSANRKFAGYSKGMKRKLVIAAGIIHNPPVLFLDEPTTGIDVSSARQIRQLISNLRENGTTIFLTTHYIEEAERLCDRIAFIVKGRIVKIDTVLNLLQPLKGKKAMIISMSNSIDDIIGKISTAFPLLSFQAISSKQIKVESDQDISIGQFVRFIEEQGTQVSEARIIKPSLEEVFLNITGIDLDIIKKEKEKGGGGQ